MSQILEKLISKAQKKGYYDVIELIDSIKKELGELSREELFQIATRDKYAGQYYTPKIISQFIAELGRLYKPKTVLDPCCGIGHILAYCNYANELTGIDVNLRIIEIARKINNHPTFINDDYLKTNFKKKYDLIVADLPFGVRVESENRRWPIEQLFLQKFIQDLEDNGTAIVIVPENILSTPLYQDLRNNILKNYSLDAIFDLTPGALARTHIKASILLIRKAKPSTSKIFFSTFMGDIPQIIKHFKEETGELWVDRESVTENWQRRFYDPKYDKIKNSLIGHEVKELSELAEVLRGPMIQSSLLQNEGKFLVISGRNIQNGLLVQTERDRFINDLPNKKFYQTVLREGDIIISLIFNDRKLYTYKKGDPPAVINHNCAVIRSVNNPFIKLYLQTKDGRKLFEMQAEQRIHGATIPHLPISNLRSIKIPIIPIEDLNELSLENIIVNSKQDNKELTDKITDIESISTDAQILNFLREIKEIVLRVEQKVDQIIKSLQELQTNFSKIKLENRDEEEKLLLLYSNLDRKLSEISSHLKEEIEIYETLTERIFENWEKLDPLSKQFLPLAEYLMSKLREFPEADYSPVILQFCKALENEVLKKLFINFTSYIISKESDLEQFLKIDLSLGEDGKERKTKKFARTIRKYVGKEPSEMKYTLGDMSFVLQLVSGENTLSESPLLQSFKNYICDHFKKDKFLSREYLNEIQFIIDTFRNKCAHPYKLNEKAAIDCKKRVPKGIDNFLDYYVK